MMKLSDLIEEIQLTTLGNLSKKNDLERRKELVLLINRGLTKFFSTFVLRERAVAVEMIEGRDSYELTTDHIITADRGVPDYDHFIWDEDYNHAHDDFFAEYRKSPLDSLHASDIIKILGVSTPAGESIPVNNGASELSVFTPYYNVLHVPPEVRRSTTSLYVYYQADHPRVKDDADMVDIPETLRHPLVLWIACQVLLRIGSQEALMQMGVLSQQYQAAMQDITSADALSQSYSQTSTKFKQNGWI